MDIVFTGLRPGEKLYEELELVGEGIQKTKHPKIFIGRLAVYPPEEMEAALVRLEKLARQGQREGMRAFLNSFLPEAKLEARIEQSERYLTPGEIRASDRRPRPVSAGGRPGAHGLAGDGELRC